MVEEKKEEVQEKNYLQQMQENLDNNKEDLAEKQEMLDDSKKYLDAFDKKQEAKQKHFKVVDPKYAYEEVKEFVEGMKAIDKINAKIERRQHQQSHDLLVKDIEGVERTIQKIQDQIDMYEEDE